MRKIRLAWAVMLIVAALLCLSACGDSGKKSAVTGGNETTEAETTEKEEETTEADDGGETGNAGGKYSTIAEYAASDEIQAEIDALNEGLSAQGMKVEVTGEGNQLVYTYTYSPDTNTEGFEELLAEGLASQADTFRSVAASIPLYVDVEDPLVVVRYLDADGNEIYSARFDSEGGNSLSGQESEESASQQETAATDSPVSGKYSSIEEFAASPEVQDEITGINESLESQGMTVEVVGEGNKLIYNYYYTELVNQEGLGEALEEGLTAEADTFSDVAASISEAVDVENPVVVVRYIDANGEVIHSQEFPAQ